MGVYYPRYGTGNSDTNVLDTRPDRSSRKRITPDQQALIDAMKDGWLLYRQRVTFNWYLKQLTPTPPFRTLVGRVYKPSAVSLLLQGVLKEVQQELPANRDLQYVLVEGM